jgi:uncharacterized membrane protein
MGDLSETRRKVRDYWFVDGLPELGGGAAISVFSTIMLFAIATSSPVLKDIALAALLVSALAVALLVRLVKQSVTYPRTGRVSERLSDRAARVVGVVLWVCLAIPLFAAWERSTTFSPAALIIATALATGASLAWAGYRRKTPRLYASASVCALAGVIAAIAGLGTQNGVMAVFLTAGVTSVVTGALALAAYLGDNPNPERESAT